MTASAQLSELKYATWSIHIVCILLHKKEIKKYMCYLKKETQEGYAGKQESSKYKRKEENGGRQNKGATLVYIFLKF